MGIRRKTISVLGISGLVAIGVIGFFSYRFNMENVLEEADIKSKIVLNYAMSSLKYMKFVQKPLVMGLVPKDRFYPELMSGFVSARGTYEYFNQAFPGYIFKQATLDPLNPSNLADKAEIDIINSFRQNLNQKEAQGTLKRGGEEVYYIAQPIKIDQKNCLKCHGDPMSAPKDQRDRYGIESGYHWIMGDTVAAFIVYVPIKTAVEAARSNTLSIVLVSGIGVLLMMLVSGFILDRGVVAPVIQLTKVTENLSSGKELNREVHYKGRNEIQKLAKSIDKLRISLVIMFNQLGRKE